MSCRLCGGEGRVMLSLTPTPIANSFPAYVDLDAERFPLDVQECFDCGHVQLKDHVAVDWVDYRYSTPEAVRPHLAQAAAHLRDRYPDASTVLEIGSNNGLYVEELNKVHFDAYGVDPCATVGIRAPFSAALTENLEPVDLIVANNVLAHVDDLHDVFKGIDRLLKDDGALVFEVQYFPELMASGAFDMIYHEHRDYHTLEPLPRFLRKYGLLVNCVQDVGTHGGSKRLYCERPGIGMPCFDYPYKDWRAFKRRIREANDDVLEQLDNANGPIVAFGATAKACTLIHHFGIADRIDYAVDSTPAKHGRYIPGTAIKIWPPQDFTGNEVFLLTAWNFADVIVPQYPQHQFIVPFSPQEVSHGCV